MDSDDAPDESLPYVPGSETSQAAAKLAAKNAKGNARRIFNLIIQAGDHGMTTDELNATLPHRARSDQSVSPRVKDLADRRMITQGPDKRLTRSNAPADVCRAVQAAIDDFDAHWHWRAKGSFEQRALLKAVRSLKQRLNLFGKQALDRSPELPSPAETQQLLIDGVLNVYRHLIR